MELPLFVLGDSFASHGYLPGSDSDVVKDYLQPVATALVALSLAAMAVDQYRTSNARFTCAEIFGKKSKDIKGDLARLGLPEDGKYDNVRGYCRAFLNTPDVTFPWTFDVNIENWPATLTY